jgi:hypothetical protein
VFLRPRYLEHKILLPPQFHVGLSFRDVLDQGRNVDYKR